MRFSPPGALCRVVRRLRRFRGDFFRKGGDMYSKSARNILAFVWGNVVNNVETLDEARGFVATVSEDLGESDRVFLECALEDREQLEEFYNVFVRNGVSCARPYAS